MLAVGTIMQGARVMFAEDHNRIEIIETLLPEMALIVARLNQTGMASASEVIGLQNMGQHIQVLMQTLEEDDAQKERLKQYSDVLGRLMNMTKGFAQRLQQQQGGDQNGQMAETMGKIQSQKILAEAKAANMRESHGQRTAQRQVQFEAKERQQQQQHQLDMQREAQKAALDLAKESAKTQHDIVRKRYAAFSE